MAELTTEELEAIRARAERPKPEAVEPAWYALVEARRGILKLLDALAEKDRHERELIAAIHRLPKPPESMGDGPDERVTWALQLISERTPVGG